MSLADEEALKIDIDNEFVKIGDQWMFQSVHVHVNFFEPISKGWAETAKS